MPVAEAKQLIRRVFRKRLKNPVVIAGLGRCGTTLLFRAIADTVSNLRRFVVDLDSHDFRNDLIKTHDYPPSQALPAGTKVVFMFGDIVDTVLSTASEVDKWPRLHFKHLRVPEAYRPYTDIFERDLLQFESLFDAWYRPQTFSLMTLRYESMYDPAARRALQQFLGLEFGLPAYRPRRTDKASHPFTLRVQETYASLDRRIETAEDYKIWKVRD